MDDYEMRPRARPTAHASVGQPQTKTDNDSFQLARLGKKPVLKRTFGFLSMLGFSCTVMITWEGLLVLFAINFSNGGYAGTFLGFWVVWIGTLCTFATMSELSSMAPTAGGQYHWVAILAPPSMKKFLSYMIGWLTVVGWQAILASGGYLCSTMLQGISVMANPGYVPQQWQIALIYWAIVLFAIFINTVVSQLLPKLEGFILVLHILGFFAILIPLVVYGPLGDASTVFTVWLNEGNWPTQGLSVLVGMLGTAFNFLGADSAVHMSEEIKNPALNVPRVIIFSIFLNGALGLAIMLVMLFYLGDPETVLDSPTGFPFMTLFQQAVGYNAGAIIMAAIIVIMSICATISFVATASRMTWAFARDRGLPGHGILGKIEPRSTLPLASIALTACIAFLLSLISFGSSVAFNDVVSLSLNGLYTSYLIGNGLLLYRRLINRIEPYSPGDNDLANTISSSRLSWGPWRIPEPLGTLINLIGCAYLIVMLLFSYFPTTVEPEPSTMNYSSLMMGSVSIFATIYYMVSARSIYEGPIVETDFSAK